MAAKKSVTTKKPVTKKPVTTNKIVCPFVGKDREEVSDYKEEVERFIRAFKAETGFTEDDLFSEKNSKGLYQLLIDSSEHCRLAVKECNEPMNAADYAREKLVVKRIVEFGNYAGVVFRCGGDPRGYTVKMQTPRSGKYNSFGGAEEGWGVVQSENINVRSFAVFNKWFLSLKF